MVKSETAKFRTSKISLMDGYDWGFYDHVRKTLLYLSSRYTESNDDRPFKNIVRPLLNLQHRAEGFDVKDIVIYADEQKSFFKSFLIKKRHEKWALESDIDDFIDEMVESYCDYGGALLKYIGKEKPEVVPLTSIAFCDQTDLTGGPLAIRHFFSPTNLLKMGSKGWGGATATMSLKELITLSEDYYKKQGGGEQVSETPGKQIEVYEVHGDLPKKWLDKDYREEGTYEGDYAYQMHVVTFYNNDKGEKNYQTLYKGKEESPFEVILRDPIPGRALGMGGVEELFHPQMWVNLSAIRMREILDHVAKIIYKTTDDELAKRQNTKNMPMGQILHLKQGTDIAQLDNRPVNLEAFESSIRQWEESGKITASANENILGEQPPAGTPFALQQLVTAESHSLHDYRRGKIASFLGRVYRKWIIPMLSRELAKEVSFLAELDMDEVQGVADALVENRKNKFVLELILRGQTVTQEDVDALEQKVRDEFMKRGNKLFIETFKDEFKGVPLGVKVNIAGKQKNLLSMVDKLTNIFRQIMASVDPQTGASVLDDPRMAKIFNQILEYSGFSPIDFYRNPQQKQPQIPVQQVKQQVAQPIA